VTGGLAVLAILMVVLAIRSWTTDEADRARGAVERFAAAVEARDYTAICNGLLAEDLREKLRQVELPCTEALQTGFGEVRRPRLTVVNVVVVKDRARAAVRTDAEGQAASEDVLSLVKETGEWRISSLAAETAAAGPSATPTVKNAPPRVVITTPTPESGGLTPDTSNLPDDALLEKPAKELTPAERKRVTDLKREQRRAMRAQGARD
jgi:hypothetical protein